MDAAMHDRGSRAFQFTIPRLYAIAGYLDPPAVLSSLSFLLPSFTSISSRFVSLGSRIIELWSPNSNQTPFYPGLRHPTFAGGKKLPPAYRRSDGHVGRFDPTVSPQHYDSRFPWLGFIKRSCDHSSPEFMSIVRYWDYSGSGNSGSFEVKFLYNMKERYKELQRKMASKSAMERLNKKIWMDRPLGRQDAFLTVDGEISFDDAVDDMALIQAEIKFMDAWCRLADAVIQEPNLVRRPIQEANESLIGTWLNGAAEEDGLRLLQYRVPCFIVNEIDTAEDRARAAKSPKSSNFVAGTPVAGMNKTFNAEEMTLRNAGCILQDLTIDIGTASSIPSSSPSERARASPPIQASLSGSRFVAGLHSPPPVVPSAALDSHLPSVSASGEVLPPPIISPTDGIWSTWTESNLEDGLYTKCMEQLGARRKNDTGEFRYFDRSQRRYLCFDSDPEIPDTYKADPEIFGLPVPPLPFVQRENNKDFAKRPASVWMYTTERPARRDLQRIYTPAVAQVPTAKAPLISRFSSSTERMDTTPDYPAEPVRNRHRTPSPPRSTRAPPASRSPPYKRRAIATSRTFGSSAFRSTPSSSSRPIADRRPRTPPRVARNDYYRPRVPYSPPRRRSPDNDYGRLPFREHGQARQSYGSSSYQSYRPASSSSRPRSSTPPRFRTPTPPIRRSPSPSPYYRSHSRSSLGKKRALSPRGKERAHSPDRLELPRPPSPLHSDLETRLDPEVPGRFVTPSTALVVTQTKSGGQTVTPTLASSSSAIVPYSPTLPEGSALESIQSLFPAVDTAPVPVASVISSHSQSAYLIIWNLPPAFIWRNVVQWALMVLPLAGSPAPVIDRIVRTNEAGLQIFWFKFQTVRDAIAFRGVVAARQISTDGIVVNCDFVERSAYAGANGRSSDFWNGVGLSYDRNLDDDFSDIFCRPTAASQPLLDRIGGLAPSQGAPPKLSRNQRRRNNLKKRDQNQ